MVGMGLEMPVVSMTNRRSIRHGDQIVLEVLRGSVGVRWPWRAVLLDGRSWLRPGWSLILGNGRLLRQPPVDLPAFAAQGLNSLVVHLYSACAGGGRAVVAQDRFLKDDGAQTAAAEHGVDLDQCWADSGSLAQCCPGLMRFSKGLSEGQQQGVSPISSSRDVLTLDELRPQAMNRLDRPPLVLSTGASGGL